MAAPTPVPPTNARTPNKLMIAIRSAVCLCGIRLPRIQVRIRSAMLLSIGISARTSKLGILASLSADGRRDVAAHPGECTAVCGGKRVVAIALRSLLRDRAARAHRSTRGLMHRPHRFEQHPLVARRLETLDVNCNRVGWNEVRHR